MKYGSTICHRALAKTTRACSHGLSSVPTRSDRHLLSRRHTTFIAVPLKMSLREQIFVADNNGAEQTFLSSIKFFGSSVAGTKMSEFKKVEE